MMKPLSSPYIACVTYNQFFTWLLAGVAVLLVVEELLNKPPVAGLLPNKPPVDELVFPNKPPPDVEVEVLPNKPPGIIY